MIVRSLQVGSPGAYDYQGKQVETAFFKYPVEGAVHLGTLGFTGDQQVDHVNHGGPDKAVLVYAVEHYPFWEEFLGRAPGPAVLGENLTLEGLSEENAHIGDTYRIGEALLQVAQPRVPCFKINIRNGRADMLEKVRETGYTGFYLRVLQEGAIKAGDRVELLERVPGAPSIAEFNQIFYHDAENWEALKRMANAPGLAERLQNYLRKRLANAGIVAN